MKSPQCDALLEEESECAHRASVDACFSIFLQLIINVVARLLMFVREDASRIGLLCEGTTNIVSVAIWSPPPVYVCCTDSSYQAVA